MTLKHEQTGLTAIKKFMDEYFHWRKEKMANDYSFIRAIHHYREEVREKEGRVE